MVKINPITNIMINTSNCSYSTLLLEVTPCLFTFFLNALVLLVKKIQMNIK